MKYVEKFFQAFFQIRLYYESANFKIEIFPPPFSGSLLYRLSAQTVKRFLGYAVKSIYALNKLGLITKRCS
jgi:hypothetical protein